MNNLVEAIKSYLDDKANLGLPKIDTKDPRPKTAQWMHEEINDEFDLEIADSDFYDSIRTAFHSVHNYKFLDDEHFVDSLERALKGRGIPQDEVQKTLDSVVKLQDKYSKAKKYEQSAGYNPNLDAMIKDTQEFDGE